MDEEEQRISDLFESYLRETPFYKSGHMVYAGRNTGGSISLAYRTVDCVARDPESTRFDIEIDGDICHINWINVRPEERSSGYGESLYRSIENFCREISCKRILLTSSGQTQSGKSKDEWWEKLGFSKANEDHVKEL